MRHKTAVRFKENVKVCMEVASLPEPAPEPCCFYPVKQPGKAGAEAASGGLKKPKKAYILTTILTTLTTILTTKNGLVGTCKSRSEYSKKPVFLGFFKNYELLSKSGGGGIRTHGPC